MTAASSPADGTHFQPRGWQRCANVGAASEGHPLENVDGELFVPFHNAMGFIDVHRTERSRHDSLVEPANGPQLLTDSRQIRRESQLRAGARKREQRDAIRWADTCAEELFCRQTRALIIVPRRCRC